MVCIIVLWQWLNFRVRVSRASRVTARVRVGLVFKGRVRVRIIRVRVNFTCPAVTDAPYSV